MGTQEKTAPVIGAVKRRGVALLGLAMIVAGGIWAAVAMAASPAVEVEGPRGPSQTKEIAVKAPWDRQNVRYREGSGTRFVEEGLSIDKLLARAGVTSWATVSVEGLVVTRDSYRDKKPPIFYLDDDDPDKVIFFRPKSDIGPGEERIANSLDLSYRAQLEIDPSDPDPKAGDTIEFTAAVPNGGSQNDYTFEWEAGTAGSGTGRIFEVTYPETDGRVNVSVTAFRDGTDVGSVTVDSKINAPPEDNSGTSGSFGSGSFGSGTFDSGYTPPTDFGGDFGGSPSPTPTPNFPDPPDDTPEEETLPEETSGVSVSGELLSQISPLEDGNGEEGLAGKEDPAEPQPDEVTFEKDEEVTAPGALIAAGVVVGLIGLGAGRELEDVRPRRFLRRPNLSGLRRLLPPWK